MTVPKLVEILANIEFQGGYFSGGFKDDGYIIQFCMMLPDNGNLPYSGATTLSEQKGRKWYVSPYATESEVVQTALKAVLTFLEHEAREQFHYKGKAIFGPHLDVEALLQLADQTSHRAVAA